MRFTESIFFLTRLNLPGISAANQEM